MSLAKILWPLFCTSLFLLLNNDAYAQNTRNRGGSYVELEPFWVKVHDSFSDFRFARNFAGIEDEDLHLREREKWHAGFHVALGYDFAACVPTNWGTSLEFTYIDFNRNGGRSQDDDVNAIFIPAFEGFGTFSDAHAKLDTTYYAVDFFAHYRLRSCYALQTQIFGGIRYAKLKEKFDAHFTLFGDALLEGFNRVLGVSFDRHFKGIGPQVGFGIFLPVKWCLGVTGQASGGFLHGDRHRHFVNHFDESIGDLAENEIDLDEGDHDCHHHWISNISTHLGLGYQTRIYNCTCLLLELGYRYDRYFNVLDEESIPSNCDLCDSVATQHHGHNDFEFHGPYLKLTWHL